MDQLNTGGVIVIEVLARRLASIVGAMSDVGERLVLDDVAERAVFVTLMQSTESTSSHTCLQKSRGALDSGVGDGVKEDDDGTGGEPSGKRDVADHRLRIKPWLRRRFCLPPVSAGPRSGR